MSLEAAFSLSLVAVALLALPLFSKPQNEAQDFFLCSDAALSLVRLGSFAGRLQGDVAQMESLSGLCIEVSGDFSAASSCSPAAQERIVLTIPVSSGDSVHEAEVSCWRA